MRARASRGGRAPLQAVLPAKGASAHAARCRFCITCQWLSPLPLPAACKPLSSSQRCERSPLPRCPHGCSSVRTAPAHWQPSHAGLGGAALLPAGKGCAGHDARGASCNLQPAKRAACALTAPAAAELRGSQGGVPGHGRVCQAGLGGARGGAPGGRQGRGGQPADGGPTEEAEAPRHDGPRPPARPRPAGEFRPPAARSCTACLSPSHQRGWSLVQLGPQAEEGEAAQHDGARPPANVRAASRAWCP